MNSHTVCAQAYHFIPMHQRTHREQIRPCQNYRDRPRPLLEQREPQKHSIQTHNCLTVRNKYCVPLLGEKVTEFVLQKLYTSHMTCGFTTSHRKTGYRTTSHNIFQLPLLKSNPNCLQMSFRIAGTDLWLASPSLLHVRIAALCVYSLLVSLFWQSCSLICLLIQHS